MVIEWATYQGAFSLVKDNVPSYLFETTSLHKHKFGPPHRIKLHEYIYFLYTES